MAEPERLTEGLGGRWLIEDNGHKPYACGVVLHPLIDAVIAIRNRENIDPAAVSEIALRVHPLVLSITGVVEPSTGLQSKFSTLHSAAVALIDGAAGVAQYSDAKAKRSGGGGAAAQGEAGRRRNAAQGRGSRHRSSQAASATRPISPTPAAPPTIR